MDGSNCKSIFVPPSVIRNGTMEQVYRGKTISMMGMIDFGLEKTFEHFFSVKGSSHFLRVRFLFE